VSLVFLELYQLGIRYKYSNYPNVEFEYRRTTFLLRRLLHQCANLSICRATGARFGRMHAEWQLAAHEAIL
jgi:hypothetical protein